MNFWKAIAAAIELHSGEEQTQAKLHNVTRMGGWWLTATLHHWLCLQRELNNLRKQSLIWAHQQSCSSHWRVLLDELGARTWTWNTSQAVCCLGTGWWCRLAQEGINYLPVYDFFITHGWFRNSYSRCVLGIVNCLNAVTSAALMLIMGGWSKQAQILWVGFEEQCF